MPIRIPARNYLTWTEAQERLGCNSELIRDAIVARVLVPSLFVNSGLVMGRWSWDVDFVRYGPGPIFEAHPQRAKPKRVQALLYLRLPRQVGHGRCEFEFLCDSATARPGDDSDATWCRAPTAIPLDKVEAGGVFTLDEIERVEEQAALRDCKPGGTEVAALGGGEAGAALESREARQHRRYERLLELKGRLVPNGGGSWKCAGDRGALAKLVREERRDGRPRADNKDVRADLHAEADRRQAK